MADTFIGEKWKLPYTAAQLQGTVTNQVPRIGASGNWQVWDIDTSAWVDTGVAADPQTAKLNVIGKGINLLDNWYFIGGGSQQGDGQFPINQRGQTSYTTTDYAIDRWVVRDITLNSGDIEATAANAFMLQRFWTAFKADIEGKTLTFSALTSAGLVSGTAAYQSAPASNIVFYNDADITLYVNTVGEVGIYFNTTAKKVSAVKLELGSTQTLAHNEGEDANPNWVLNDPPPDFQMEYIKCITSTADPSDTYANKPIPASGFAPAGYGLGGSAKTLTNSDNIDNVINTGFYGWASTSVPTSSYALPPMGSSYVAMTVVNSLGSPIIQTIYWNNGYGGHTEIATRKSTNGGATWFPWEYENPLLVAGEEYRTTERYIGKPVYAKLVDFGALPNATTGTKAHGITNLATVLECTPIEKTLSGGSPFLVRSGITEVYCSSTNAVIVSSSNLSSYTVNVLLKYTKTTD